MFQSAATGGCRRSCFVVVTVSSILCHDLNREPAVARTRLDATLTSAAVALSIRVSSGCRAAGNQSTIT